MVQRKEKTERKIEKDNASLKKINVSFNVSSFLSKMDIHLSVINLHLSFLKREHDYTLFVTEKFVTFLENSVDNVEEFCSLLNESGILLSLKEKIEEEKQQSKEMEDHINKIEKTLNDLKMNIKSPSVVNSISKYLDKVHETKMKILSFIKETNTKTNIISNITETFKVSNNFPKKKLEELFVIQK